jgi:hypothetical protein
VGVSISYQKSLISRSGCAEFAKRFKVKDLRKDISPLSIISYFATRVDMFGSHGYG